MSDLIDLAQIVRYEPGDFIVLSLRTHLPEEMLQTLVEQLRARFPDNHVIVLAKGVTLAVVKPR